MSGGAAPGAAGGRGGAGRPHAPAGESGEAGSSGASAPRADSVPREHRATAPTSIGCFVLTISDSKTPETDTSGILIRELLAGAGHRIAGHAIVRDEPADVTAVIRRGTEDAAIQAFVLTGGTGVTSRDSTFEAVEALLDKRLTGFGELFRMLSWEQVGAAAMLSRAQAGVVRGRALFSLPGSPNACRLALEKLILPELGHLLREISR